MDEAKKTEYMMKKRKDGTFSILRKTDSGPVGMFHKLDKKAADNIMKKLEGGADARDRRERGMPDAKGQRLFASFQEHVDFADEQLDEMSAKAHYKTYQAKFKAPPIDRDRYPNREAQGLEGPFQTKKTRKIFYYDKKAGKYYDPDTDMYLQVSDIMEDVEQVEEKFEFQFADKETAQKFMREVMQKRLGNSTGTRDGQVTTMTNSGRVGEPTMAHKEMAKTMKKHGGKLTRTDEGPALAKIFEETVELDEMKKSDGPFTVVALKGKKVVGQLRNVEHNDIELAIDMMRKDKQGAKISVESKSGKVVHTEEVEQVDEAMAPFPMGGGGKRKPATKIGKDTRNQLEMTKPSYYSFSAPSADGGTFAVIPIKTSRPSSQAGVMMAIFDKRGKVSAYYGTHMDTDSAKKFAKKDGLIEDVQLDEEVIKARVAFFGRPSKNNSDMRDAKKKNMFVDAKDVDAAKGKMFDVTFHSRRQFNRFESEYDFLMVKVFEDVQIDEERVPTYVIDRQSKKIVHGPTDTADAKLYMKKQIQPRKFMIRQIRGEAKKVGDTV